jgi:hypothetical protein
VLLGSRAKAAQESEIDEHHLREWKKVLLYFSQFCLFKGFNAIIFAATVS